jgi:hypothetical protein
MDALKAFDEGASVVVFTNESGMYTDESHGWLAVSPPLGSGWVRRELLFASDVRMSGPGNKEPGAADRTEMVVWGGLRSPPAVTRCTRQLGRRLVTLHTRSPWQSRQRYTVCARGV